MGCALEIILEILKMHEQNCGVFRIHARKHSQLAGEQTHAVSLILNGYQQSCEGDERKKKEKLALVIWVN